MTEQQINALLSRPSSMGAIMTGVKKGWDVENSLTCKRKLVKIFREHTWKRYKSMSNKYTEKGLTVEEDAITLYSRVKGINYTKNAQRLNNDCFTGELDVFDGTEILKASRTIDMKASWDWTTFPSILDEVDDAYDYQGQGYMDLTGAGMHVVAHCLLNTPARQITDEMYKLSFKPGMVDKHGNESQTYKDMCKEIERNCIVCLEEFIEDPANDGYIFKNDIRGWEYDIPLQQRVNEVAVVRDNKKIERMRARCVGSKQWLLQNREKLFSNLLQ